MWSLTPTGTVVVFVHGFNGDPVDTWSDFENLLPTRRAHDLVFFGYESRRTRVEIAALALREFVSELHANPSRTVNSTLEPGSHRQPTFHLDRIVLVGHSLGAVVTRRALLIARSADDDWKRIATLLLYAPAHMGAHVAKMAAEVFAVFKVPLPPVVRWWCPMLTDLEPDSLLLKDLRTDTQRAIDMGDAEYLRARLVVLAERDDVVNTNAFSPGDAPGISLPRGHIGVCKPSDDFTPPLELLLRHT